MQNPNLTKRHISPFSRWVISTNQATAISLKLLKWGQLKIIKIRTEEQERLTEMQQTLTLSKILKMFWWIQVPIIVSQLNNIWHSFLRPNSQILYGLITLFPIPPHNLKSKIQQILNTLITIELVSVFYLILAETEIFPT